MKRLFEFLLLVSFLFNVIPATTNPEQHVFNPGNPLHKLKDKCKGGEMKKRKCVCPENKILSKGVCIDNPLSKKCKNSVFSNGKCNCNKGFKLNGKFECIKGNNMCIGGKIKGGVCKCPAGQKQQNGKCMSGLKCKQGERLSNGKCLKKCPPGLMYLNGKCIRQPFKKCPQGKILLNEQCIRKPDITCPSGTILRYGQCVKQYVKNCPSGTILRNGQCVRQSPSKNCASGTRKVGNNCLHLPTNTYRPKWKKVGKQLVYSQ